MQHGARADRLGAVDDDGVEPLARVGHIFQPIGDDHLGAGIIEAAVGNLRIMLEGKIDDGAVDLAQRRLRHRRVLEHFAQHAAVAATDHQHARRRR